MRSPWQEEAPVGPLTTFGAAAHARCLAEVASDADVRWALEDRGELPLMVLGGGSNVLMHRDWMGRMLHMNIRGVQKIADDGDAVEVVVGAGESWHAWVMHALDAGWNGLENLALIPGSVGASPMQNIGAYGVEVKDRFAWLEAIHRETGALERFDEKAICRIIETTTTGTRGFSPLRAPTKTTASTPWWPTPMRGAR